jgi:hypothetical protein
VEAVAWISGLEDVLCVLFMTLALWQYLLFAKRSDQKRARVHYWVATAAFVLGRLSKPTAVVTPMMAWALDRWCVGRSMRSSMRALWGWGILAVMVAWMTRYFQPASGNAEIVVALWKRPIVAIDALGFYLWKLVWPVKLGIDYGRTPARVAVDVTWGIALFSVAAVAVGVFLLRRRKAAIVAGAVIFVAALMPVLGMVSFDFQLYSTVADRYAYPAMIGAAIGVAMALVRFTEIWKIGLGCALLIVLGMLARRQSETWESNATLYANALDVNPGSWLANNDMATVRLNAKDAAGAARFAMRALELRPGLAPAELHLAEALSRLGKPALAIEHYEAGLRATPGDWAARQNLATAYAEVGELDRAIEEYEQVLHADPNASKARRLLEYVKTEKARRATTTRGSV